jgi:hypothetical protein
MQLNDELRKQIEAEAKGDAKLNKTLTTIVGRLITTIEPGQTNGGS